VCRVKESSPSGMSTWDRFRSLFHLLTGDSQPSNHTTPPAAGRRSTFCQVTPNRPHPCPAAPGVPFAMPNSFAVSVAPKVIVELGHLCPFERTKPRPARTQVPRPAYFCRPALMSARPDFPGGHTTSRAQLRGVCLELSVRHSRLKRCPQGVHNRPVHSHTPPYSVSRPPQSLLSDHRCHNHQADY
jgi:hypothetical protein